MDKLIRCAVVSLFGLYILLTVTVQLRLWQTLDWDSLIALQHAFPRWVDLPFSLLTLIGSAEITGLIFLVLLIRAPAAQRVPLLLTFGTATLIELIGKTHIDQPSPPHDLVRYIPIFPLILSAEVNTEFSFPSGHALRTLFIAIVLANFIAISPMPRSAKRALLIALVIFEAIMLVSRVYLAEHWTMDIVGGTMLGVAFALVAMRWKISLPRLWTRKLF